MSEPAKTSASERRHALRHRSFLQGRIYFNKGRSAVDCLIRDISDEGARIIFSDTVSIPDVVDIYVPQKAQTLRARVEWRHGEEAGIAFEHPALPHDPVPVAGQDELTARVANLEAEVANLWKLVKRLKLRGDKNGSEAA